MANVFQTLQGTRTFLVLAIEKNSPKELSAKNNWEFIASLIFFNIVQCALNKFEIKKVVRISIFNSPYFDTKSR